MVREQQDYNREGPYERKIDTSEGRIEASLSIRERREPDIHLVPMEKRYSVKLIFEENSGNPRFTAIHDDARSLKEIFDLARSYIKSFESALGGELPYKKEIKKCISRLEQEIL